MGIGDTFSATFWQYSIPILLSASSAAAAAAQQRPMHNIAGVCPHAGRRRPVLGSVCSAEERIDVKTFTADSETFDLKPDHELHTVQLTLRALALRVIAHPLLTQLNYCRQLSTVTH